IEHGGPGDDFEDVHTSFISALDGVSISFNGVTSSYDEFGHLSNVSDGSTVQFAPLDYIEGDGIWTAVSGIPSGIVINHIGPGPGDDDIQLSYISSVG